MKKVLIVEKDDYTSEILAESLTTLNYNPIQCSTQSLAVHLTESTPDIVIIHRSHLIKHAHLFLSAADRNDWLSQASIIVTSNSLIDSDELRKLGADFFLFKPYGLETLSELLKRVLNIGKKTS